MSDLKNALAGLHALKQPAPNQRPPVAAAGDPPAITLKPRGSAAKPKPSFTEEQRAFIESTETQVRLEALAGTGKTHSLVEYARRRHRGRWLYVVFNKAMQAEAERVLPAHVKCQTLHALAYARFGHPVAHKLALPWDPQVVRAVVGLVDDDRLPAAIELVRQTLNQFLYSADPWLMPVHIPPELWNRWTTVDPHASVWPDGQALVQATERLWAAVLDPQSQVPTIHDAWVKQLQLSGTHWPADGVLLDEAQDISHAIAAAFRQQPVQQVSAGDPNQAIYGWRGAEGWTLRAQDTTYRLTGSFRFGPEIAALANAALERMQSLHRVQGLGPQDGRVHFSRPLESATILARTHAGAWALARKAVGMGWRLSAMPEVPQRWVEAAALRANDRQRIQDPWLQSFESYAAFKAAVKQWKDLDWRAACRWAEQGERLHRQLGEARGEGPAIVLNTIHQTKGQSIPKVWLAPDLPLHEGKAEEWSPEEAEDARLVYTAITRAQHDVYVDPDLQERWVAWTQQAAVPEAPVWDDGF